MRTLIGATRFLVKKEKKTEREKRQVSANYALMTLARAQKAAVVNVRLRPSVAS